MTHQRDYTVTKTLLDVLLTDEQDGLRLLLEQLLNLLMLDKRQTYLQAEPYQRTPARRDHANGFKAKTLKTRLGPLALRVPQVRKGHFYPSVLTKGLRSERAVWLTIAEQDSPAALSVPLAAKRPGLCAPQGNARGSRCTDSGNLQRPQPAPG